MYDIIAKLGQPCIFIRYNPDNINSSKEKLLQVIKKYLKNGPNIDIFNNYGFKAKYLFY